MVAPLVDYFAEAQKKAKTRYKQYYPSGNIYNDEVFSKICDQAEITYATRPAKLGGEAIKHTNLS